MERTALDTSWLDEEPTADEFEWLESLEAAVEPPGPRPPPSPAPVIATAETDSGVRAATKLPLEALRGKAMFQHVKGKKRIWACDGEYVFFRRPRDAQGREARDAQGHVHAAITRHQRFIDNGDYEYVETQDDVEICKVNERSSFWRKGVYLGEMTEGGVRQAVIMAAMLRDWPLYVDCLEELARKVKGKFHQAIAEVRWTEHLNYIENLLAMRRGPSPDECARGLQQVRQARGVGSGKMIVLPSR